MCAPLQLEERVIWVEESNRRHIFTWLELQWIFHSQNGHILDDQRDTINGSVVAWWSILAHWLIVTCVPTVPLVTQRAVSTVPFVTQKAFASYIETGVPTVPLVALKALASNI